MSLWTVASIKDECGIKSKNFTENNVPRVHNFSDLTVTLNFSLVENTVQTTGNSDLVAMHVRFGYSCKTKNEHGEEKNERENMWVWEGKKSSKEGNAFSEAKRTKCTPRERWVLSASLSFCVCAYVCVYVCVENLSIYYSKIDSLLEVWARNDFKATGAASVRCFSLHPSLSLILLWHILFSLSSFLLFWRQSSSSNGEATRRSGCIS